MKTYVLLTALLLLGAKYFYISVYGTIKIAAYAYVLLSALLLFGAWYFSLSVWSTIGIAAGIYIMIGFMKGGYEVYEKDVFGNIGPGCTVLAWCLLWPLEELARWEDDRRHARTMREIDQP